MRDYDKELREAVRRLLETTSTFYKDVPLVEIKELPNVGAAWENVKDKPTAVEVEARLGRALVAYKTTLAAYIGSEAVDKMQADLDALEKKIDNRCPMGKAGNES